MDSKSIKSTSTQLSQFICWTRTDKARYQLCGSRTEIKTKGFGLGGVSSRERGKGS